MKNDDFLEALSRICNDPEFENKLKYNKRVRAKTIGKGIFFSVALIVLIGVVILFGSIYKKHSNPSSSGNNGDVLINTGSDNITPFDDPVLTDAPVFEQTPEPGINNNGSFGEVQIGREILFGQDKSKPTTGHKIGLRFYNFSTDNVISIEAYMNQFISTTPGFFEFNGYPVFEVYEFNPYKYDSETCTSEKINNTNLIINDAKGNFEKRFTVEDLSFLGVSDLNLDVFEAGHREALTINFDNYSVGDFVHVAFSYGFFYYKNNPYNASKRDNSWVGQRRFLTFYIGEYGIYISEYRDEDIVIEEYKNITEGLKEFGHNPPEGFLCTAKPLYLRPLSAGFNKVLSGEVFETGFRIVSNKKYDKYMIKVSCTDGISIIGPNEYQADSDVIGIKYFLTECRPFGMISIEVHGISNDKDEVFLDTIYCISGSEHDYASIDSLDSLKDFSPELKTYLEGLDRMGESGEILRNVNTFLSYNVHGYIRWKDSDGLPHPAKSIIVDIYSTDSTTANGYITETCITDANV